MDLPACSALRDEFVPAVSAPPADAGRVLYLDNVGNLALVEPDGAAQRMLTEDAFIERSAGRLRTYRFPAPSPDGSAVAVVRVDIDASDVRQTVETLDLQSGAVNEFDVVRDWNVPYVDWSPDGSMLAWLAIGGEDAAIRAVARADSRAFLVQRGAPAYWHWRPDSRAMMTHVGGRAQDAADDGVVNLVAMAGQGAQPSELAILPGQFQSPQFSPDGRHTLYAANIGPSDFLVVGDASGMPLCAVTRLDLGAFFAWSPDGVHVAFMDVVAPAAQTAPVRVVDVRTGASRVVSRDALMFFWSPDGSRLAIVSAVAAGATTKLSAPSAQQSQLLMRVEVVDASDGSVQRIADLHPTVAIVQYVQYFDQYSRAITPWSPDGRSLAFAGALEANGPGVVVVAAFDAQGEATTVRRVADGALAMFMRR